MALRRSRYMPLPWGLMAAIAIVVLTERYGVRGNLDFVNNVAFSWAHTGKILKYKAPGRSVLCFGDSQVKFGVLPRVLADRAGGRAFSLAIQSGPAPASYFLLRRALNAGARPSAIVVDFARTILADGPESAARPYPWADLLTLRETLELSWECRDPDLFASVMVRKLLPSENVRFEVRANLLAALKGESTKQRHVVPALRRNWNVNEGAQVNPKLAPFADSVVPESANRQRGSWACDPINARYLGRFMELAARHRIAVYWLLPPVSPGTLSHWNHSGDEPAYLGFVRHESAKHTNLTVIDGRSAGYAKSVFLDGVHVDREGATALSLALGDIIGGRGDARGFGRWVALPPYTRPVDAIDVEDMNDSLIAIYDPARKRRR